MKALFLLIPLIFFLETAQGQKTAEGFYVNLQSDSIPAAFRIPKSLPRTVIGFFHDWSDLELIREEIEIVDSGGQSRVVKPSDAISITFQYNSNQYQFYSKPISETQKGFLTKEAVGSKAILYQYIQTSGGGMDAWGRPIPVYKSFYWTLEKMDGSHLFINSKMNRHKASKLLQAFFRDSPETQQFTNKKFYEESVSLHTIKSIVATYNSL